MMIVMAERLQQLKAGSPSFTRKAAVDAVRRLGAERDDWLTRGSVLRWQVKWQDDE
jgi:hypothetical protein